MFPHSYHQTMRVKFQQLQRLHRFPVAAYLFIRS